MTEKITLNHFDVKIFLTMNILILTHISPPAIDGGSKVIHQIGDYLQQKGHKILKISSNCSSTDDFTRNHQPVNHQLPVYTIFHRPLKLFKLPLTNILQKGPIFKLIPFIKITHQIYLFKPQLIIAGPLPTTIILYAKFFQKLTQAKLLIHPSFHPPDPEFQNPIILKILKSADYLWTLTNYENNYFQKQGLKNTLLLGNGLNHNFLIEPNQIKFPKTPNLLFIGSFSAHKGIDKLLKVFRQLNSTNLTLAGQKTLYYPQLQPLLNLPHLKIFIKPSDQKIKKLIDDCTVLVLPSTQESFGLVLIEAMARGKPVLVNPIPELLELINKTKAGLPFNLKNTKYLLAHPQRYGLRGLNYVSHHYTWDKIGQRLCQKLSL